MDPFNEVQGSLEHYIRSRQEVGHIRRVLTAHLDAQIDNSPGDPRPAALSLPNDSTVLKPGTANIRGLRKEYLRALRANVKARRDYDEVANSITSKKSEQDSQRAVSTEKSSLPETDGYMDTYLALVKQRQRHERLRILQNYADTLSRKSAASSTYLEEAVEKSGFVVPRVPEDIINSVEPSIQESSHTKLKYLIHNLEKSVLQAKISSKREKHNLAQLKASLPKRQQHLNSTSRNADALEALGRTRNELIAWVEHELGKTVDTESPEDEDGKPSSIILEGSVDQQLALVKSQYALYIKARQDFLQRTASQADPAVSPITKPTEADSEAEAKDIPIPTTYVLSPYLIALLNASNEQKAFLQQRSHLTVSLSKHHKEASQLFDRLAEESHLLPAHPLPSQLSRPRHPLGSDMNSEVPSTAHRARAWTFAAESAATATMEAVLMSTEEGGVAVEGARRAIADLGVLLGRIEVGSNNSDGDIWTDEAKSAKQGQEKVTVNGDIWASLDGRLGVIKRDNKELV